MSINNQKGLVFPTCFPLVTFARDVTTYFALYSSFLLFNVSKPSRNLALNEFV